MAAADLLQHVTINVFGAGHGHADGSDGAQGGGSGAAFEERSFAENGAGADLRDRVAVDLNGENAVEEQVQLAACCTLLGQQRSLGEPAKFWPLLT